MLAFREERKVKAQAFKEKNKKEAEDKAAVRDYERKRAAAGSHYVETALDDPAADAQVTISGDNLNVLWERVRNFFNDRDQYGNDVVQTPAWRPAKERFMDACGRR